MKVKSCTEFGMDGPYLQAAFLHSPWPSLSSNGLRLLLLLLRRHRHVTQLVPGASRGIQVGVPRRVRLLRRNAARRLRS